LTPGGLCHPADNFGAVLAVAEHVEAAGADFLLALAIAYEVQCRFSAVVPVMARGLNHALQLAMSVGAATSKLLGFDAEHAASAIAASTADNVSLAAVHAEPVSTWKGISPATTGMRAVYTTILAGRGVTGPYALIDGPQGLSQLFDQAIDLRTDDHSLTVVEQTYLKRYCSLIHAQIIIDATLAIRDQHHITGDDVAHVTLEVFQGAYDFAGGGRYGNKDHPWTKEQADYNLKYLCAVALLDGQVGPEQIETSRAQRADVQGLLKHVTVSPRPHRRLPRTHLNPGAHHTSRRPHLRPRTIRLRRFPDPPHDLGPGRRQVPLACRAVHRRHPAERNHQCGGPSRRHADCRTDTAARSSKFNAETTPQPRPTMTCGPRHARRRSSPRPVKKDRL
jgi:2-methylcitrate dehydratase PrpD